MMAVGAVIVSQKMMVDGAFQNWWWAKELELPI
jgi:hypothetical protein